MKNYILLTYLICACLLFSCTDDNNYTIDNAVYFPQAAQGGGVSMSIDNAGGSFQLEIQRLKANSDDIQLSIVIDTTILNQYNVEKDMDFLPLPSKFINLEEEIITIPKGQFIESIDLNVKIDSTFNNTRKYAIPLRISSVKGSQALEGSETLLIFVSQLIETTVPLIVGAQVDIQTMKDKPIESPTWSVEVLFQPIYSTVGVNNWVGYVLRHDLTAKKNQIFSRFCGDIAAAGNGLAQRYMIKTPCEKQLYSNLDMEKDVWAHVALTCDGETYKLYMNGNLHSSAAVGDPSISYFNEIFVGHNARRGYLSEFRVWSVVRSEGQLRSNMYIVDPTTEGLEVYYRLNETSGSTLKDLSGNERHGFVKGGSIVQTKTQIFPPQ